MNTTLTQDAIRAVYQMSGSSDDPSFSPTLQVIHLKTISNSLPGGEDRWKMVVSDGDYFLPGIMATQLNHKVTSGDISQFALIKVNDFIFCDMPSGQRIFILLNCDFVFNPEA